VPIVVSGTRVVTPGQVVPGSVTAVPAWARPRVPVHTAQGSSSGTFTDGRDVTSSNVGYLPTGVSLTNYTGATTITTDNTVIDSKYITDNLTIRAKNVTIKRSLFQVYGGDTSSAGLVIGLDTAGEADGFLMEDCEMRPEPGLSDEGNYSSIRRLIAIWGRNITIRRCYLHGFQSGIRFYPDRGYEYSGHTTIEDCWIGGNISNGSGHVSTISSTGVEYVTVQRCRLDGPKTPYVNATTAGVNAISGTFAPYPESQPNCYWTVDRCYIDNGPGGSGWMNGGYTPSNGESANHHWTISNNFIGSAYSSEAGGVSWNQVASNGTRIREAWTLPDGSNVWTNNVTWPGGVQISAPS
jgi:hypothetical protein